MEETTSTSQTNALELSNCMKVDCSTFPTRSFFLKVSQRRSVEEAPLQNAEVLLIQSNTCEVIDHVQFNLFRVLGHKKACVN